MRFVAKGKILIYHMLNEVESQEAQIVIKV
jgi:hypothetical protein